MAKELPYFKFIATEWLTGNIIYESFELQGLFINICALYWQRGGFLSLSEIEQRYKKKALIAKLTDRFISVSDGYVFIEFLNEQFAERQYISKTNSNNGKLGGKPTHKENLPTAYRNDTDTIPNHTNIEEEKNKKENKIRKEFIPPSFEVFKQYCKENNYEGIAKKAFDYYSVADWKDSKGNQVKNWKQKLIANWFKEDNKTTTTTTTTQVAKVHNLTNKMIYGE